MLKTAKSIEELYEETKQFDLVITNDAPLNTALNKQLNKSHLGYFALTSKMLGSKYADYLFEEPQLKTEEIVLKVQNKFQISLKEALHYTKNILTIWQKVGDLKTTKHYLSKIELPIANYIEQLPTYQRAMEEFKIDFLNKQNIAVIGEELFTKLDKRVLPKNYRKISTYKTTTTKLPTIYQFNSQKEIIDQITNMITPQNQNGIAVVVDTQSEYLPLLKSKLINNNIELQEQLYLHQEFNVREYLSIIEILLSTNNLYTKELIPIGESFNIEIDSVHENTLFSQLVKINKPANELYTLLKKLKNSTFGELTTYQKNLPEKFIELLHTLELYNQKITKKTAQELRYFIENFDQEFQTNKSGVLLIDAKNSTYINRDVVFYIEPNHNWVKTIDKQHYLNSQEELQKNLSSFEILLQQGKEQYVFVQKQTVPPYYFNLLTQKNIESYSKEHFTLQQITTLKKTSHQLKQNQTTNQITPIEVISNSALNKFAQCPKKYEYSKLITGPNKDFFLRGELVHAFAEFYINYKEVVHKKGLNEFVEIIMNQLTLLSNPLQNSILKTQITCACISITQFIDNLEIDENITFSKEISKKNQENIFAKHFNLKITKPNAELEFLDTQLQLRGIIDLVVNSQLIIDYKTGKKKTAIDIAKKADIQNIISDCDFQPLVYLTLLRKLTPNTQLAFWYQFPMINTYQQLLEKQQEDTVVKVHYIPQTLNEYLQTQEFKEYFSSKLGTDAKKIFENYNTMKFFKQYDLYKEIYNKEDFTNYHLDQGLKENKSNLEILQKLLKYILGFKFGEKIGNKGQKEVFFFKEDIDEFETFIKDTINKINSYSKTSYPYKPVEGKETCKNCDFKKICLKQGVN